MCCSRLSRQKLSRAGRAARRLLALSAGFATAAFVAGVMPGGAAVPQAVPDRGPVSGLGDIVAFKDVRLVYRAAVSDSDNCSFTNVPGGICSSDATWDGGTEHLIRSFSGVVTSVVPITIKDALKTPGKGTSKATESAVKLSATNTYSHASDALGDCSGMSGTNTEAYAKTSTTGSLTVDGLTAVRDRHGSIIDFNLALQRFNESGPGENVKVTRNVTAADESSCVGTSTDSLTELFGTGDIDVVHGALGLLNATGDVKLTHWTLNPKWLARGKGLLATKTVTGTAHFEAPDSGLMHLHETLQIYAAGIWCSLDVFRPRHSLGHVAVRAQLGCNHPVTKLRLRIRLFINSTQVSWRAFVSYHTNFLTGRTRPQRCLGGQHHYHGVAKGTAIMPGYIPGFWTTSKRGPIDKIDC